MTVENQTQIVMHRDKDDKEEPKHIQQTLFKSRQIFLSGGVGEKLAKKVIGDLLALEAEDPEAPITLIVNSPGGSVNDGFAIYDTIRLIKPEVRILTMGLCASIATIVLIAAPKKLRMCTPNTRLLIHQPHIPMQVFGPASDLEITATEIIKTRERINVMLAEACNKPLDEVSKDTQRDFWMSAKEAVEYGLVSQIVSSREELDAIK